MAVRIEPNSEPIPGYRLIERLGGGGFGEVWKCEAPGGLLKAIKFVFGNLDIAGDSGHRAEQELKALSRVKTVRHPYILSLERFDIIEGQLLIIMELADRNLWDRYRECRQQGLSGIPRGELLGYMQEAAEALDLMNSLYQLQHLDIKPQNLFLVHQHVKVADFGLVKDMEGSQASVTGGITPVYAAPETFDGRVTRFSDQYSLAIVFQELLTGQRPFAGANVRQLILQHLQAQPNLSPLEENDRPIMARALSKTPEQRYPTCNAMVHALVEASTAAGSAGESTSQAHGHQPVNVPSPQECNTWGPQGASRREATETPLRPAPSPPPQRSRDSNQPSTQFIGIPGASGGPLGSRADASAGLADPRVTPRPGRSPDTPGPAREMDPGGGLCPALVVGLGGLGSQVLQSFRSLLAEQFGSPEALPVIRTLLIDTDPDVLRNGGLSPDVADKLREAYGAPTHPLTPGEFLLAPLNRPSHYLRPQPGRVSVESWINPRMLYRIPREQMTTGIRALGRLALFDHVRVIQRRLQMEMEACGDIATLERAGKSTGRGVRSYRPRIFLVASLMGGTGGGMFLDLAYLLRNLSRQMGMPNPQIAGLLFIPQMEKRGSQHPSSRGGKDVPKAGSKHVAGRPSTGGDPSARLVPLGNTCAALTELHHYSRLDTEFIARYYEREAGLLDGDAPFNPVYLLPLPERPLKKESQELVGMTARFLLGECASAFGRWRGTGPDADIPGEPMYRTLGLYRVSFPGRQVVQAVATQALRKVVARWMSKDARPLVNSVSEWLAQQWRERELGAEHFIERIQDECEKRLGKDPQNAFNAALEPLLQHFGADRQKSLTARVSGSAIALDPEVVLEVLSRLEQLLGRPQVMKDGTGYSATDWNASSNTATEVTGIAPGMPELTTKLAGQRNQEAGSLLTALREAAQGIANDFSQQLAEVPVKLIEKPAFRLAGAEEAVRQVVSTIEQILERHEPMGRDLADKAADAYGRVVAFLSSLGDSRSWPRRGMTPEQVLELLRTYAKSRYQSQVLQQMLSVYVSMRGCLSDELREINFCRVRLQDLLNQLEVDKSEPKSERSSRSLSTTEGRVRHLFPRGWGSLKEAEESVARGLTADDLLAMDERLQKMIRANPAFVALVNVCLSSKSLTKELAHSLGEVATVFVEEKLGATDVSQLFLAQKDTPEAVGEELVTCFEESAPDPAATGPGASRPIGERVVVGVPSGKSGDTLRLLVQRTLGDTDLVLTASEEDLILFREWSGLRLAAVDPLGPAGQEAYQCLLATENYTPHSRIDVSFEPPR